MIYGIAVIYVIAMQQGLFYKDLPSHCVIDSWDEMSQKGPEQGDLNSPLGDSFLWAVFLITEVVCFGGLLFPKLRLIIYFV
jgi:hypothetical protein